MRSLIRARYTALHNGAPGDSHPLPNVQYDPLSSLQTQPPSCKLLSSSSSSSNPSFPSLCLPLHHLAFNNKLDTKRSRPHDLCSINQYENE
ncbi:hypothetical protein E2C01_060676 [Portunus trituberculatus]|uniref:Uncharacterized protein n=1 Tax=Portunus trituberculatus TaxID=210409 RepID=A0A5B7HB58_PORTR|nr:hypothetical protein [Portunus trituberculatus]